MVVCVGSVDSVCSVCSISPCDLVRPAGLARPIKLVDSVVSVSPRIGEEEEESVEVGTVEAKVRRGEDDSLESSKG